MPNIGALLKEEISRLCRREVRRETAVLKRASVSYRHDIATLKRHVAVLTRQNAMLSKRGPSLIEAPVNGKPLRFVAKGLVSLRKRLDLSAAQLARLLNVSEQSVYNWEAKKTMPRKEQVTAIAALRSVGKREAVARLEHLPAPRQSAKGNSNVRKRGGAAQRKRAVRGKRK